MNLVIFIIISNSYQFPFLHENLDMYGRLAISTGRKDLLQSGSYDLRESTPKESVSFPIKVNNKPYFCNLA